MQKIIANIPLSYFISITGRRNIFPLYHCVSDRELTHVKHLYAVKNVQQFTNDIDSLLKHYEPFSVEELTQRTNFISDKGSKPKMAFTFDDGLRECYDIIAPILLRKGIPAIFFINTGFIDNKDLFYRFKISLIIEELINNPGHNFSEFKGKSRKEIIKYLKSLTYNDQTAIHSISEKLGLDYTDFLSKHKPYMSTEQINSLIKDGFLIGGHSVDHPDYKDIPINKQIKQTIDSMTYIENLFNIDYRLFAFPFSEKGVANELYDHFSQGMKERFIFFGTSGFVGSQNKIDYLEQRIPMEVDKMPAEQLLKLRYASFMVKNTLKNILSR